MGRKLRAYCRQHEQKLKIDCCIRVSSWVWEYSQLSTTWPYPGTLPTLPSLCVSQVHLCSWPILWSTEIQAGLYYIRVLEKPTEGSKHPWTNFLNFTTQEFKPLSAENWKCLHTFFFLPLTLSLRPDFSYLRLNILDWEDFKLGNLEYFCHPMQKRWNCIKENWNFIPQEKVM